MKQFCTALKILLMMLPALVNATDAGFPLMTPRTDITDKASLQRGAKVFVNYCLSCHSAQYMRYSRIAHDLELNEEAVSKNLMFTTDKIGNTMKVSISSRDAEKWFGVVPPDLSVIARARGIDWLYTFLNSFYLDPTRSSGVNNALFTDTAMPHVLWELQGWQTPVIETVNGHPHISELKVTESGQLKPAEYQALTADLVNFLAYVGEPGKLQRLQTGKWVLGFLLVLLVAMYYLKKEYWKDIH